MYCQNHASTNSNSVYRRLKYDRNHSNVFSRYRSYSHACIAQASSSAYLATATFYFPFLSTGSNARIHFSVQIALAEGCCSRNSLQLNSTVMQTTWTAACRKQTFISLSSAEAAVAVIWPHNACVWWERKKTGLQEFFSSRRVSFDVRKRRSLSTPAVDNHVQLSTICLLCVCVPVIPSSTSILSLSLFFTLRRNQAERQLH